MNKWKPALFHIILGVLELRDLGVKPDLGGTSALPKTPLVAPIDQIISLCYNIYFIN